MKPIQHKTWGDVFRAALRRGYDHGYAAYLADKKCLIKAKKDFAEETGCPVCNMQLRGIEELRYCENCGWTTEGDS